MHWEVGPRKHRAQEKWGLGALSLSRHGLCVCQAGVREAGFPHTLLCLVWEHPRLFKCLWVKDTEDP